MNIWIFGKFGQLSYMNNIDLVDKHEMVKMLEYTGTRGHQVKIYKRRLGKLF